MDRQDTEGVFTISKAAQGSQLPVLSQCVLGFF